MISGCSASSRSVALAQARNSAFLATEAKKDATQYVEDIKRNNIELSKMLKKLKDIVESAESSARICVGQS